MTTFVKFLVLACALEGTGLLLAQPKEPRVSALADVQPGLPRAAVLAGLASEYTLVKQVASQDMPATFELWDVQSKVQPQARAEISFLEGKVFSVRSYLLTSQSPDVVKFVDALQSALYGSLNPPTNADPLTMALAKIDNNRYGTAQIKASQSHSPEGDSRGILITVGGRMFEVNLDSFGGRTTIFFTENKMEKTP